MKFILWPLGGQDTQHAHLRGDDKNDIANCDISSALSSQYEMKTNSKVIQALIKYRITIVWLCFAALMIIGFWVSLIIGATSENNGISKTISNYILTIIFISVLLLGAFFLITGMVKSKMRKESAGLVKDESEIIKSYDEAMSFGFRKVRIFFACLGSFIALTIIVVSLCILFGFQDYLETIFMALFYIGGPV